jgi:hypothetical protein
MDQIGAGGMGVVFRAQQKSLNRLVAVKVLSPQAARDREFCERFHQEARAAAALNHPNIVHAIAVGEAQGLHYFAMELLEGETARQRLEREGPLPLADVLEIGRQTALGLAHAHGRGMLHRDIKPENLMLSVGPEGLTVKIMDMGLARHVRQDTSLTQEGTALGTPLYNSPEQARGSKSLGPATDLYSLGATMFHLATGRPPFEGDTAVTIMTQHITEPPPNPQELNSALPDEVCRLLLQLLSKKPEDRYESAEALAEDLASALEGGPLDDTSGQGAGPARGPRLATAKSLPAVRRRTAARRRSGRSSSLAAVLVVLALLAACGAAAWYYLVAKPKAEAEAAKKTIETPEETAERQRVDGLLAAAEKVERDAPDDPLAQQRAWMALKDACGGRGHAATAVSKLVLLESKIADAAADALGKSLLEAKQLTVKHEYDEALKLLAAFRQKYPKAAGMEHVDTAEKSVRERAEAEGERALKRGADLEAAGNAKAAIEAYVAAARIKYAPIVEKATAKIEALKGGRAPAKAPRAETKTEQPRAVNGAADEREKLAAQAWDEAERLLVEKKYQAAQLAFQAFKADFAGTKTFAEKSERLALRLEALEILTQGEAQQPKPAPLPKTQKPSVSK